MGVENMPFFLPIEGDRDTAHRDIEIVGLKILHQLGPCGLNVLNLDAERLAQRLRHIDVESPEFRRRLVEIGKGQIVAGHTDPQCAAFDDVVEPRGLLGMCRGRHQKKCDGEAG